MLVHDYLVKRKTVEQLESQAIHSRKIWGLDTVSKLNVYSILFEEMPESLSRIGLKLVLRSSGHMGDREAYAAPDAKRIFFRSRLLAQLKFGDPRASVIFLHELAHVLLHPGAEKAWVAGGNNKINFIEEECSAEWQATTFTMLLMAPTSLATACSSVEKLSDEFGLDFKHADIRHQMLQRTKKRALPDIYDKVKEEMSRPSGHRSYMPERCTECGASKLIKIEGKYLCEHCGICNSKFQDGDL